MMTIELQPRHCALCGEGPPKSVKYPSNFRIEDLNPAIFSARRSPDRRHFRLVECSGCGMIFSDPSCDPRLLAQLYHQSTVDYGHAEQEIFASYAPVLDRALTHLKQRKVFVEIGGGNGFMLRYGAERGFSQQLEIEPSSDAQTKFTPCSPAARFICATFHSGLLPAGSASMVCFFQMLDHVPDPLSFLGAVHDLLEPGGVMACVTHNTRALSARLLGERSPIFDIEHTYLFHQRNLTQLLERAGFEVVETFSIANAYSLRSWLHLAPVPKAVKQPLSKLFEASKLAQLQLSLRAGNFAVIAKKASFGARA